MIFPRLLFFTLISFTLGSLWGSPLLHKDDTKGSISISATSLPGFREVYNGTFSEVQFYNITASALEQAMLIEAEYPLKISLHCHDHFVSSLSLSPANGQVQERIYVRAFPKSIALSTPRISHSSAGVGTVALTTSVEGIESQVPSQYYSTATATGRELKTQLHNIIINHYTQTYASLWAHFQNTDATFEGKVWDMYSDIPCQEPPYLFSFGTHQDSGSGGNSEGEFFNREHSMPRSWFGGAENPMNTDLYHIFPVDKHVNAVRNNWPYGVVNSPTWTSQNGGKLGPNAAGGTHTGTAFEPIDDFKGDLARGFLYMITRYEDRIEQWTYSHEGNNMLDHQKYPGYQPWVIEMLMQWHIEDPVSHKERLRNNAVYLIQGNRNPYVDHPEFVDKIWGDTTLYISNPLQQIQIHIYPNPATGIMNYQAAEALHELQLIAIDGRILLSDRPEQPSGKLDLHHLPAGTYVLRYRTAFSSGQKLINLR